MKLKFLLSLVVAVLFLSACSGDDANTDGGTTSVPKVVSTTPANGATGIAVGIVNIAITYDGKVSLNNRENISISGGNITNCILSSGYTVLNITAECGTKGTMVVVTIPQGVISNSAGSADAYTLSFTTEKEAQPTQPSLSSTPVAATDVSATKLYAYLLENYQKKILTGMMANVAWNNEESEKVYQMTGKYPAINGYDYIHLPYSAEGSWINYGDITPVKTWADNHGIVTVGWHWCVPSVEGGKELGFYKKGSGGGNNETTFKIANAITEGTWENQVVKADMERIANYLKLLQNENIPVLWRPLHEASGGWFWWGAGTAEHCKKLWVMMFDYFKQRGLTNLIWVWTDDKEEWYPGDNYVDVVGCDAYGESVNTCVKKYNDLQTAFSSKMIALTECGYSDYSRQHIAGIADQWQAGAKWSWFMPWYGASTHAPSSWWDTFKNEPYVIWRDDVNF